MVGPLPCRLVLEVEMKKAFFLVKSPKGLSWGLCLTMDTMEVSIPTRSTLNISMLSKSIWQRMDNRCLQLQNRCRWTLQKKKYIQSYITLLSGTEKTITFKNCWINISSVTTLVSLRETDWMLHKNESVHLCGIQIHTPRVINIGSPCTLAKTVWVTTLIPMENLYFIENLPPFWKVLLREQSRP